MTTTNEWSASQSIKEVSDKKWKTIGSHPYVFTDDSTVIDYNIQFKVEANKKIKNGTPVGYKLSTDKKNRVYQLLDSTGTGATEKTAQGVLLINPGADEVDYKTANDKPLGSWIVILRNATIPSNLLTVDPVTDLEKISQQLCVNANIKVIPATATPFGGILEKSGGVT